MNIHHHPRMLSALILVPGLLVGHAALAGDDKMKHDGAMHGDATMSSLEATGAPVRAEAGPIEGEFNFLPSGTLEAASFKSESGERYQLSEDEIDATNRAVMIDHSSSTVEGPATGAALSDMDVKLLSAGAADEAERFDVMINDNIVGTVNVSDDGDLEYKSN